MENDYLLTTIGIDVGTKEDARDTIVEDKFHYHQSTESPGENVPIHDANESLGPSLAGSEFRDRGDHVMSFKSSRDKIAVNRFNVDDGPRVKKNVDVKAGRGVKLGDIPEIDHQISKRLGSEEILKGFHRLLYNRPGEAKKLKGHLREFSGLNFCNDKDRETFKKHLEKWTVLGLKDLCEILTLEKSGEKDSIIERLIEFLLEPHITGKRRVSSKKKRAVSSKSSKKLTKRIKAINPVTSATEAFERFAEVTRKSEEFKDIKEYEGGLEEIISQRWASMSTDEREPYEKQPEKKESLIHKQGGGDSSHKSPCDEKFEVAPPSTVANSKLTSPTDEILLKFITTTLASANLSQITKKTIREIICEKFKLDPLSDRQRINELIEQCLSQL